MQVFPPAFPVFQPFPSHMRRHDREKPLKAASMPQLGDKYIYFCSLFLRRKLQRSSRAFAWHTFRHSTSVLKRCTHFEPPATGALVDVSIKSTSTHTHILPHGHKGHTHTHVRLARKQDIPPENSANSKRLLKSLVINMLDNNSYALEWPAKLNK